MGPPGRFKTNPKAKQARINGNSFPTKSKKREVKRCNRMVTESVLICPKQVLFVMELQETLVAGGRIVACGKCDYRSVISLTRHTDRNLTLSCEYGIDGLLSHTDSGFSRPPMIDTCENRHIGRSSKRRKVPRKSLARHLFTFDMGIGALHLV
ncbi:hypothetical protein TNCV_4681791 [Trichonephila clavipes]|nr:hypothetical protein TNCV_4681791 [Trichonephila clavipes]